MLVLEGNLTCVAFPSQCNVVVRNYLVLVLKGKLMRIRFPSLCTAFDGNVVVPIGNLTVDVIVNLECIHLYILCIVPRCLFQEVFVM